MKEEGKKSGPYEGKREKIDKLHNRWECEVKKRWLSGSFIGYYPMKIGRCCILCAQQSIEIMNKIGKINKFEWGKKWAHSLNGAINKLNKA